MVGGMECGCGCGAVLPVSQGKRQRKFVNKEHHLDWMVAGGASQMNAAQPIEAKKLGGHVAGTALRDTGHLAEIGKLGVARSLEISAEWRAGVAARTNAEEPAPPTDDVS